MELNLKKDSGESKNLINILFFLFAVIMNLLIWGLTAAAIYFLNWSPWTVLVAMVLTIKLKNSSIESED